MNKQFLISVVVLFIASMAFDFTVHGVLLKADYEAQPALMRKEADAAAAFSRDVAGPCADRDRHHGDLPPRPRANRQTVAGPGRAFRRVGHFFAACVPGFLIYYAVQPVGLVAGGIKQICFGGIDAVLLGILAASRWRE